MIKLKTTLLLKQHLPPAQLPTSLRTNVGETIYARAKTTGYTKPLHEEPHLREWRYWAIIENAFPYDMAFKIHHMLIPKRVAKSNELTDGERLELSSIMEELNEVYDCLLVNFTKKQSIRQHFHIHLLTYKDNRADQSF